MDANEIQKHIEMTVEPKMGEAYDRNARLLGEGVRALWEIAFQLSKFMPEDAGPPTEPTPHRLLETLNQIPPTY